MSLKDDLRAYAHSIGIDLIGVTASDPFPEAAAVLREREAKGYRSRFEEPDIELRTNPEHWLPGTRSIIVAGLSYLTPAEAKAPPADPEALKGWISRYCQGQDYHLVLKAKLSRLGEWLEEQVPGVQWQAHVDTGPPVDRETAVRAGLGFYGKSCMLIAPGFGTWLFLGSLITTLALEPDGPGQGTCGECRRCLDACPTGALVAPYTLDSNRCLSYITQMKGYIPREFRAVMGNRLFGCDDCQDVCPYNKRAKAAEHPEFFPEGTLGLEPDLGQILSMTKGQFKTWFQPTAAGWRGKTVLQRNAVVALGNSRDPRALPLLLAALNDERPVMRGHAAWALGQFNDPAAHGALRERLNHETDPDVITELTAALQGGE